MTKTNEEIADLILATEFEIKNSTGQVKSLLIKALELKDKEHREDMNKLLDDICEDCEEFKCANCHL